MADAGIVIDGRYRLLRRLGAGGMGEVWVAHQESLDRDVAIKLMRPEHIQDAALVERFHREARALSKLRHENIVTVHDTGTCHVSHVPFIVMELLAGDNLRKRMGRGPMAVVDALDIIQQVVSGLAAAHKSGVTHRDVKPENIVLDEANASRVKLVDFGIARTIDAHTALTNTGSFMGTVGYAAPELALGSHTDDPRSDLYAVGVILHELLTGRPLFDGATPLAIAMRHAGEPAPRLSSRTTVPAELDALTARLLEKDPHKRPTAAELGVELEKLLATARGAPGRPASPRARSTTTSPPSSSSSLSSSFSSTLSSPSSPSSSHTQVAPFDLSSTAVTASATVVTPAAHGTSVLPPPAVAADGSITTPWLQITVDRARKLIVARRTSLPTAVHEVGSAFGPILNYPVDGDRKAWALLLDFRAAKPNSDPAYEEAVRHYREEAARRYRRVGVLLKTAVGVLQVERMQRNNRVYDVFTDEGEAVKDLLAEKQK